MAKNETRSETADRLRKKFDGKLKSQEARELLAKIVTDWSGAPPPSQPEDVAQPPPNDGELAEVRRVLEDEPVG